MKAKTNDILVFMSNFVDRYMTAFQSDFYNYDYLTIQKLYDKGEPFEALWIVNPNHTYLMILSDFPNEYASRERTRIVCESENPYDYHFTHKQRGDRFFIVTEHGCEEYDSELIRLRCEEWYYKAKSEWRQNNPKVVIPTSVDFQIHDISEDELAKLVGECDAHDDVTLQYWIDMLKNASPYCSDHSIHIFYSKDGKRFDVKEYVEGSVILKGAIKFHGWPETGYEQNGSFQLCPSYGWSWHS